MRHQAQLRQRSIQIKPDFQSHGCPTMSQLAGSRWNQPFCTQEQGSDCCLMKLHRMQQVLALSI